MQKLETSLLFRTKLKLLILQKWAFVKNKKTFKLWKDSQ